MTFKEIDFVKIQKRQGGSYLVTIPALAVKELSIVGGERMKVSLSKDRRQLMFEILKEK